MISIKPKYPCPACEISEPLGGPEVVEHVEPPEGMRAWAYKEIWLNRLCTYHTYKEHERLDRKFRGDKFGE